MKAHFLKISLRAGALLTAAFCALVPAALHCQAASASYTGTFATDDDQRVVYFTLPAAGPVTIRTFSYAGGTNQAGTKIPAGGFDPTISIFDVLGNLVSLNRDGGCGAVAADPVTSFCWDSSLSVTLPAGSYSAVLTQSENLPNGPALSDSFVYHGEGTFTTPPGVNSPGFWDEFPNKRTASYALDIVGATSLVTTITSSGQLPFGIAGSTYGPFTFTAASGVGATMTWSVANGSTLPPGLSLNATTGVISGTPASNGSFSFVIQASDGIQPVTQKVSMAIYGALTIQTSSLPPATAGLPYGPFNLATAGGSGSYSWTISGIPANMTVSASGVIGGTAVSGGSFPVSVTVTDTVSGQRATSSMTLVITVIPMLITSSVDLGGFVPGATISGTFAATGGITPYKWSTTGLPAGLSVNATTGAFSGNAGSPGAYSFSVKVADAETPPLTINRNVSFSVMGFTTQNLPGGTVLTSYSTAFAAAGGTPPYTFSSSLPQGLGLSLSATGALSGTPQSTGNFTLVIQVSDSAGLKTSSTFTLAVGDVKNPLAVPGGTLTSARAQVPYSSTMQASGGTPPYVWSVSKGVLPGGISLTSSGTLAGTPTAAGTYTFTVQVVDGNGGTVQAAYTLIVNPAVLTMNLGSFPVGIAGEDYPVQIFTAVGGVPAYTYAVTSGSLPPGLTLSGPQISGIPAAQGTFAFTVTVTDSAGQTGAFAASLVISPAHADLILSQTSVAFSLTAGASGVPSPASVTVRSSVVQLLLNYSFTVSPAAPWLIVAGSATTPGAISMALDPSATSLPASATPYATTITVTCAAPSPCAGSAQTINVSLTVSAPPPQLSLTTGILTFNAVTSNPTSSAQTLGLRNTGSGVITINSITTADGWISISGVPATLTAGPPALVTVTANPVGLGAGYFTSTITIASSAGTVIVPVTMFIAPNTTMTMSPAGGQFSAPAGNLPGNPAGSFSVSVTGGGSAKWAATLLPGSSWLSVNSPAGTSNAASAGIVNYTLNPTVIASLPAADYYATIQVTSPDVADSPQNFQIVLNVTPASTAVKPVPSAAGLVFISSGSGTAPSQSVSVYSSSAAPLNYQASAATIDHGNWLSVAPSTGSASSDSAGASSISVNPAGLLPGIYRGGVSYAFSSDAVRTVNVTMLITVGGSVPAVSTSELPLVSTAATPCAPTRLVATQIGLFDNFAQLTGWPVPLAVKLIDDCGAAVADAQIRAAFSNGDPPLALMALDSVSGVYFGTWTPQGVSPQVTVTATATGSLLTTTALVTGEVRSNNAPILSQNGTVNPFNSLLGAPVAPGEIVSIYGSNLAAQVTAATTAPLPGKLGGTSVLIGGIAAPLYYVSPAQINAQIPYELAVGNRYQVQVSAGGASSTPGSIAVAAAVPGMATDTSGRVIAQHDADYSLISPQSPAKPGEYIVLYLVGMGATDNAVATGAPASADPLSRPLIAPVITLNGSTVTPSFAGLTPGAVGLYQINMQVPLGTPDGDLELSVSQGAIAGNIGILSVHK